MVVQANVAQTAAAVLPRTGVETVVVTEIADLHPQPKRSLINFLVKYVKRMVPPFRSRGANTQRRAEGGCRDTLSCGDA